MARNPVAEAIVCASCGAKFNADRDRCPRCRARVESVDPAAVAASSRRLQRVGGALLAITVVVFGAAWVLVPSAPSSEVVPVHVAARPAAAAAPAPAVERRDFMDAPARGTAAYHGGDPQKALEEFQQAIARNPQDAEALSNAGQMLVRLGRAADALPYFDKAVEANPDRWAYVFNRARAYAVLSRWSESINDYRRAEQLFPNDYATAFNLALTLHKSGDQEAAVTEYQKAIGLAPEDASFRQALAISLEQLGRKADAASAYSEYLRLDPQAPDADKVKERIAFLTGAPAPAASAAPGPAKLK